jgi:hypothetical protein
MHCPPPVVFHLSLAKTGSAVGERRRDASLDADSEIDAFPSVRGRPVKREIDAGAGMQARCRQVHDVDTQRGVPCGRIMHGPPAIHALMHDGGGVCLDAKRGLGRHRAHLVVETPDDAIRGGLVDEVPLHRLRWSVEHVPVLQRSTELEVLPMGPDERPRGARCVAEVQFALGKIGGVPDLFRQEPALARERLERFHQVFGYVLAVGLRDAVPKTGPRRAR